MRLTGKDKPLLDAKGKVNTPSILQSASILADRDVPAAAATIHNPSILSRRPCPTEISGFPGRPPSTDHDHRRIP